MEVLAETGSGRDSDGAASVLWPMRATIDVGVSAGMVMDVSASNGGIPKSPSSPYKSMRVLLPAGLERPLPGSTDIQSTSVSALISSDKNISRSE